MKTSVSVQTQATSSEAGVLRLLPHIKRQTSSICKKFLWHFLCYPHDSDETNWSTLFCGLIMPVSVIERPLEPPCMSETMLQANLCFTLELVVLNRQNNVTSSKWDRVDLPQPLVCKLLYFGLCRQRVLHLCETFLKPSVDKRRNCSLG